MAEHHCVLVVLLGTVISLIALIGLGVYSVETKVRPYYKEQCETRGMSLSTMGTPGGFEFVCLDSAGRVVKIEHLTPYGGKDD